MSIDEIQSKIKPFVPLVGIILLCAIFFYLGRLSVIPQEEKVSPIILSNSSNSTSTATAFLSSASSTTESFKATSTKPVQTTGEVIGSKTGKKYYFPWCGTVKRIKPENRVKFASIEEARLAGYLPGGNCKGLR